MRAVQYLRKRFEFAAKSNGMLRLNQNDIDALNQIIEFTNTNKKNTALEDALMLLFIHGHWKAINANNEKIRFTERSSKGEIFTLPGAEFLLKKLSLLINPKKAIIAEITNELWVNQAMNKIPKEKWINETDVEKLMDEVLQIAKLNFPIIRELDKNEIEITHKHSEK